MRFTDHLDRDVVMKTFPPRRIVSLVPSQTELLASLHLVDNLVGITRFCVRPHNLRSKIPTIGGTKNPDLKAIIDSQPDLLIANKEENRKEDVLALAEHMPVWVSDVVDVKSALDMIREVGRITDTGGQANALANRIQDGFVQLRQHKRRPKTKKRVAYLIWKKPWMAAGPDTFIDAMLQECQWQNVFENQEGRYPSFSLEELQAKEPDAILLSSEPYRFSEKHIIELKPYFPKATIQCVDGELFSWYGSRLLHAPAYFQSLMESL